MKDEIIKNLVESNKELQKKIKTLEKKVNDLEHNEERIITNIEGNNQYGRRNNLEISGIPNEIEDENLEKTVIKILKKIDVDVVMLTSAK